MNPVVHFELPYENRDRMAEFYTKAFGWKTEKYGEDMGNYVVATTAETDDKRMIKEPGRINGGFYKKTTDAFLPSLVVAVDDIREAMKQVVAAGGTINQGSTKGEPIDIPNIGLYVGFVDTEGNKVSLLQPSPKMTA